MIKQIKEGREQEVQEENCQITKLIASSQELMQTLEQISDISVSDKKLISIFYKLIYIILNLLHFYLTNIIIFFKLIKIQYI